DAQPLPPPSRGPRGGPGTPAPARSLPRSVVAEFRHVAPRPAPHRHRAGGGPHRRRLHGRGAGVPDDDGALQARAPPAVPDLARGAASAAEPGLPPGRRAAAAETATRPRTVIPMSL